MDKESLYPKTDYKALFHGNPMVRFAFPDNKLLNSKVILPESDESEVYSIQRKILAEIVDSQDNYLIDMIIRFAEENGISELFLIDREFVLSALQHEIERRNACDT